MSRAECKNIKNTSVECSILYNSNLSKNLSEKHGGGEWVMPLSLILLTFHVILHPIWRRQQVLTLCPTLFLWYLVHFSIYILVILELYESKVPLITIHHISILGRYIGQFVVLSPSLCHMNLFYNFMWFILLQERLSTYQIVWRRGHGSAAVKIKLHRSWKRLRILFDCGIIVKSSVS